MRSSIARTRKVKEPMRKTLTSSLYLLILAAVFNLPQSSRADCGSQLSVTITNLPEIDLSGYQVFGLNRPGEITGYFYVAAEHPPHAFLYGAGILSDLGTLGGDTSQGNAINASGQIAGESQPFGAFVPQAFFYDGTNLADLGTLGGSSSRATLINDAGQAAGFSLTTDDAETHAFLYANGAMLDLVTLGGTYSAPFALNDSGQVAGQSTLTNGELHAFLYSNGTMHDLGTLGGQYSAGFSVNNVGAVVGESSVDDVNIHPFLFANNAMTDLQGLGGSYASAFSVNNANQVLGYSSLAPDTNDNVFYHGFIFANGHLTDLGTLGGDNTFPYAQNNLGQVVGQSDTPADGGHAFLWQNGVLTDLNALLPTNSGWRLDLALYINDTGRIVGVGLHNGSSEWFIMDMAAANDPPVAVAGPDQVADCQSFVTLDGSHSFDPDGDALSFAWSSAGNLLGTNATIASAFGLGTNVVTLKVTDPCGAFSTASVTVIVIDTNPPVITSAPSSVTIGVSSNCQGVVPDLTPRVIAIDGCSSSESLVKTQTPLDGTVLEKGDYIATVSVADGSGNVVTQQIALHIVDATAPVISSLTVSPNILSPPNHQMIPVSVSVNATDNCGVPVSKIVSITCNENVSASEIQITGDLTASLAASRNGGGNGRVYTITVRTCDGSGNSSTGTVTVTVPQGSK